MRLCALAAVWLVLCPVMVLADGASPWDWPSAESVRSVQGEAVTFASHSPFALQHVGDGEERDPETTALGRLFLPKRASAAAPVPAVVLLHGAGGVLPTRELTYGPQLAALGVAALVVDVFAARRHMARGFTERLLNITEAMLLADAYEALRFLGDRAEVDADRIALIGFSYGAMAATYAAFDVVAERYAPDGRRFAAHVAFYGPCIARFEETTTTGAPVLMLAGAEDAIVDPERCDEVIADLVAGGSKTRMIVYPNAYHQWDGNFAGPRPIGRNLADCRLRVEPDGVVRDRLTRLPMIGTFTRRLILAACVDSEGYLIGRDDAVRARSNRDLAVFLDPILSPGSARPTAALR